MKTTHGQIIDGTLVKRGTQVVKFWKHNGYAIPTVEFHDHGVNKVRLYTKYDGILEATKEKFDKHGIVNIYQDETQVVLPLEFWEVKG